VKGSFDSLLVTLAAAALLALLTISAAGCAMGMGEGGGAGGPKATELPKGDRSEVRGNVFFHPGWRKLLLEDPARWAPAGLASTALPGEQWERAALSSLVVQLSTERTSVATNVAANGAFGFPPQKAGPHHLSVLLASSAGRTVLATASLPLERRSRVRLEVELSGLDWPALKAAANQRRPLVTLRAACRAPGMEFNRVYGPAGLVKTSYPDGTVEYGAPGEEIRVFCPDGSREVRAPPLGSKPRPRPLLSEAKVEPLLDPADTGCGLLRWTAALDREGTALAARVVASVYGADGKKTELELLDDGSKDDLEPGLRGHQGSGDSKAGDGLFSRLTAVDRNSRRMVYNGAVLLTALGESGQAGTRAVLFLYGPAPERAGPAKNGLAEKLGALRLLAQGSGIVAEAEFVTEPGTPIRGGFFGPDGQEAPFIPEPESLRFGSSLLTGRLAGYCFAALANPEGVYYAGTRLQGPPSAPRRLDLDSGAP
jgi:hypothetical protein